MLVAFQTGNTEPYIFCFQDFQGLNLTGVLDEETVRRMDAPRCGMSDVSEESSSGLELS